MQWSWGRESSFSNGSSSIFFQQNEWHTKKETIIFLHGFPDGPIVWGKLAKNFNDKFNIIIPYLPGVHPRCVIDRKLSETFHLNILLLLKSDKRLKVKLISLDTMLAGY